ncbi:MAG: hypothetical protein ACRD6W_00085, partial [Nitrososphaerales archaeon]
MQGLRPLSKVASAAIPTFLLIIILTAGVARADTIVTTVTVGNYPAGVAVNTSNGNIYVGNEASSEVNVLSDTTYKAVANTPLS